MKRYLQIIRNTARALLLSYAPIILLALVLIALAFWWVDPLPPETLTLATGPEGSAYAELGKRYQRDLASKGVRIELVPTRGSLQNLKLLREGKVDFAFVRSGSTAPRRQPSAADREAIRRTIGAASSEPSSAPPPPRFSRSLLGVAL